MNVYNEYEFVQKNITENPFFKYMKDGVACHKIKTVSVMSYLEYIDTNCNNDECVISIRHSYIFIKLHLSIILRISKVVTVKKEIAKM